MVVTKASLESGDVNDNLLEEIYDLENAFALETFYGDPSSRETWTEIYHGDLFCVQKDPSASQVSVILTYLSFVVTLVFEVKLAGSFWEKSLCDEHPDVPFFLEEICVLQVEKNCHEFSCGPLHVFQEKVCAWENELFFYH